MQYKDMIIEASEAEEERIPGKGWLGRFKVRVLDSPGGGMEPEKAVPIEYDARQLKASLQKLETRELDQPSMLALGRTLGMLLLPPKLSASERGVRELFAASLDTVGQDGGLRLRLRLPPQLAALPWEYMYVDRAGGGDGMDGFLALDPHIAIVRQETLDTPGPVTAVEGTIKVIVAMASAVDLPTLDLKKEQANLEQAFGQQAGIKPVFLPDATLDDVQSALADAAVFHFAGHGVFIQEMGEQPGTYTGTGALALDDRRVNAEQLGINLRGNGVRLAVLGACESGRRDGTNMWSGIAPALVKADVPAVVANQFPVRDNCAIAFSKQFYQALVGGLSVERAVTAGRIAAYNIDPNGRDWGVPVLYLRAADGRLFAGAPDREVRESARSTAEADVNIRVKEVAAGGEVLGAEVREMLAGKLAVQIDVAGVVYGKVVGIEIDRMG